MKQENIPEVKKVKKEEDSAEDKEIAEQNKIMFKYRDQLQSVSKEKLADLFKLNNQEVPSGNESVYKR